ncbi:PilW family protein [Thalassolituus oleivorans]|uniref:PilW family protein n=1 Tax=Thalassolituus oleivorans TaxID=187493 RepID=UPI0023F3B505|nr:PilW family protein [Thalassolituus oleivorans]
MKSIKSQIGMTLIELMIAMVLSIGVVYAVTNILITSNRTATLSDSLAQSQETGRFVTSYLNHYFLRSGYSPDGSEITPFEVECANAADEMCTRNTNDGVGDQIAVIRTATTDDDTNCFGGDMALAIDTVVVDVFWVETDPANNLSSLYCLTYDRATKTAINNNVKQPIAAGVVAIHALYGQSIAALASNQRNATQYVAPRELATNGTGSADWSKVFAIKFAVLTQSFEEISGQATTRNYIALDADAYTFNDRFAYQVFSTTVARANY